MLIPCGLILSSFLIFSNPKKQILGRWELRDIVRLDTVRSPVEAAFYKLFSGLIYEYKTDSVVKVELSKEQAKTSTIELSPARYFLATKMKKKYLVHILNGFETWNELVKLTADSLIYTDDNEKYILTRIK